MSNISLSSQLSDLVFSYSVRAGDLYSDFLNRPLGASFNPLPAKKLIADIAGLRFALSLHCKSKSCEYCADHAQTLFSLLDIANSSLERIK